MDDEPRAKMAEAALLAVEDIAWTFGISHADTSDARAAYIKEFGNREFEMLNIIGDKMDEVKL